MGSLTITRFLVKLVLRTRNRDWSTAEKVRICRMAAECFDDLGDVDVAQALRDCQFSVMRRVQDKEYVIIPFHMGPIGADVRHVFSMFLANADRAIAAEQ